MSAYINQEESHAEVKNSYNIETRKKKSDTAKFYYALPYFWVGAWSEKGSDKFLYIYLYNSFFNLRIRDKIIQNYAWADKTFLSSPYQKSKF